LVVALFQKACESIRILASLDRFDRPGFVQPEGMVRGRLGPGFKLHEATRCPQ
jgi:hypothetical protein